MLQIFLKRQKQANQPKPGIRFNKAERFPQEPEDEYSLSPRSPTGATEQRQGKVTAVMGDHAAASANLALVAEASRGIAHEARWDGQVLAAGPQPAVQQTPVPQTAEKLPAAEVVEKTTQASVAGAVTPERAVASTPMAQSQQKTQREHAGLLQHLESVERDVQRLHHDGSADRIMLQRQLEEAQAVSLRINDQLQEAVRIAQQESFVGFVRVSPLEGGAEFMVPFRAQDSVAALKERIEESEGVPAGWQLLILEIPGGSSKRLTGECMGRHVADDCHQISALPNCFLACFTIVSATGVMLNVTSYLLFFFLALFLLAYFSSSSSSR